MRIYNPSFTSQNIVEMMLKQLQLHVVFVFHLQLL